MSKLLLSVIAIMAVSGYVWSQTEGTSEIRDIGGIRRGEFVAVQGEITRFRERDELRIEDSTGRVDIYLGEYVVGTPPFQVGDTISVRGWVDDDLFQYPKEIYATEIVLADGTRFTVGTAERWD